MAVTVVNSCRSLSGCWTCRLRKKKCDENRPLCSTCTSLELACHGYGPRPEWMDKGMLERDQALIVKRIVSQTKSKRPQRRLLRTQKYQPPAGNVPSWCFPSSVPTQPTAVIQGGVQDHLELHMTEGDLSISTEPMWGEPFYDTILPAESLFNPDSGIRPSNEPFYDTILPAESFFNPDSGIPPFNQRPSNAATAIENGDMEYNLALSNLSERESTPSHLSSGLPEENSRNGIGALLTLCHPKLNASCHDLYLSRESVSSNQVCSSSLLQKQPSSPSGIIGDHASSPESASESISRGEKEDSLLMYYLDRVFYVQYPFYHSGGRQGRGWLFSILKRTKSAYSAALALSEHHQYSTQPQHSDIGRSPDCLREKGGHYDQALREMQLMLAHCYTRPQDLGLSRKIEILASTLLLLFWELFNGGRQNWQTHLGVAAGLVPALVQARVASTIAHSTRRQDGKVPQSEDDFVTGFLIGSFLSIDIISCASTRSSPVLELDHKFLLERAGIDLEALTGCRNWAMIFIFEISLLDKWKKEAEKAYKLSFVELTKRGGQIAAHLREKLADIDNNTSGIVPASASSEITKIFGLSAMTYLYVVISGAYPELPEIMESVSKTIDAFQSLTDPKLLRDLVWPFCISGCLALEGQQAIFRDLLTTAEITQSTVGTCFEAFNIMEECWKARKTCLSNCDWVSAMDKRGHYVLLG